MWPVPDRSISLAPPRPGPAPNPCTERALSDNALKQTADQRFEQALAERGARDPREFYRAALRELRERDAGAFRRALHYYENELIPRVAAPDSDPLAEWLEYGRVLAALRAPGRTVQIDATGRAEPYARPVPTDRLVLHLPDSTREPALLVGLPPELSAAQRASFELLVKGKQE